MSICFVIVGCSQDEPTETLQTEQIEVESFTVKSDQGTKEVADTNDIKTVVEMLENAQWEENIEVEMVDPPDYRFRLNSIHYAIWVTPNKDRLEIVAENQSKYIKLPSQDSKVLYKITTGNEL